MNYYNKHKICSNCGAWYQELFQQFKCRRCLLAEFKTLRPMIDNVIGTRYISNPDESSTTISASLPAGRELFEIQDTLELVEPATTKPPFAKGGRGDLIIPWIHFHRKRYLSSTYPRKY
jgi:ribosomal protein L40E